MVTFKQINEAFPPLLLEAADKLSPYEWNSLLLDYVHMQCQDGIKVEGEGNPILKDMSNEEQLFSTVVSLEKLLSRYPIFFIDSLLEPLIEGTTPNLNSFHVPYPSFFINKVFEVGNTKVMGIFVQEMESYLINDLMLSGYTKEQSEETVEKVKNMPGIDGEFPRISFSYIIREPDGITITVAGDDEVISGIGITKHTLKILKHVMNYAVNVCSIITTRVDIKNPTNRKKDVQMIPRYLTQKAKKEQKTQFSTIRVFGDLKEYAEKFEKEIKKRGKQNVDAYLVRGHERVYKNERYVNVVGERRWILPYIKGTDRELYAKLVKIEK